MRHDFALALGLAMTSGACVSSGGGGAVGGSAGSGVSGSGGSSATGGSAGSAAGSGGASAGAAGIAGSGGVPLDYATGSWVLENLSNTAGTITHDGRLVFVSGQAIVAWSEPDSIDINDQDIFAGPLGQLSPVTQDTKVQNAYPALSVADGVPLLAFSGYPDGDNDVFFTSGAFSSPINLTSAGDVPSVREDYAPVLAVGSSGERAIAYVSTSEGFAGEFEVRVLEWTGTPGSLTPATAISGKGMCDDPSIARDAAGKLHVLAPCGPLFQEHTYYATNSSGSWQVADISGSTTGNLSTQIALSADGQRLIAIWVDGDDNLQLATALLAASWSSPSVVAQDARHPVLATDAAGRILIAFHRMNAQNMADVFFTWSDAGSSSPTFATPIVLTPNTDTSDEWMPSALVLEPDTGYPHVLYAGLLAGSDPVNSDVWRARFVPAP